jgi:hypothetical protein|tara:strand:+ start:239 stop:421 length:183 start_codon:yes stop_codon:yes gene_type:complete
MMLYKEEYKQVIENEILEAKKRLGPHDTGHIHTAIGWMEHRLKEIQKEIDESVRNNHSEK